MVYARLDHERALAKDELDNAFARGGNDGYSALMDREARADELARRVARLSAVERGLCFGRIDDQEGERLYIGRMGLRDEWKSTVLVDWRAPAARHFYTATPATPGPVTRRRHIHTDGRTVVGVYDEAFDLERLSDDERSALVGEAALLASLGRGRTGRMGEVVATIQAEQDEIIRAPLSGALVVQGGPGTGKTVAALHRAAYLLYTHREILERRGILVVGPNAVFLRYIGDVLPALGETDVVFTTVGTLYPGVEAQSSDRPATAAVKGDLRMVDVLANAVAQHQRAPKTRLRVEVHDMELSVNASVCREIRDRGRDLRLPHNVARKLVVTELLDALAQDQARQLDQPVDAVDLRLSAAALWAEEPVRSAIDALWPPLSPTGFLRYLLTSPEVLDRAAPELTPAERDALRADPAAAWSVEDIPLIDELAELLGEDNSARLAAERRAGERREDDLRYAQGVLEYTGLAEDKLMTAEDLAERADAPKAQETTAQRAGRDRTWAYGHVIVDEAQELSAMAWRTVLRRVPTRSLTIVGDTAQTSNAGGARSWSTALGPHLGSRWSERRLTVNYRTPAPIMDVASEVLRCFAPESASVTSARTDGEAPRSVRAGGAQLSRVLPGLVERELAGVREPDDPGTGRLAVLVPDARHAEVAAILPDAERAGTSALDAPASVLSVAQAKGLEFDVVVIVDPAEILAQSPMGARDLYVAITRATRVLTVVYEDNLPEVLQGVE
ncbi:AAA family ATPase [Spiractinospora alimapuensis]|nr:ATP-binding domain-containing protein [Spiractinospora alimapuensis]QVQ54658.1 AAA family ATPase [Spiractinospora alimapuensis]